MLIAGAAAAQDHIRLALYHTGLGRTGPGLLLRDIRRAQSDVLIVRDTLVTLAPDVVVLLDFDWDLNGVALAAFADLLMVAGHPLPHRLAPRPNSGIATGIDLDGDGRLGTADDAQGWGRFAGAGGMAVLSRWPLERGAMIDHTAYLWRDLPGARLPRRDDRLFPDPAVFEIQRLASVGAWEIAIRIGTHPLTILAAHAGPPVFGGAENRNFNRNADETAFWRYRLDGRLGPDPKPPFVLLANTNLDPDDGDGDHAQIRALLTHPALQDPRPAATLPTSGAISTATANWPDGPGALRVDYALPSAGLRVLDSGLIWPSPTAPHAVVWVDIAWPP